MTRPELAELLLHFIVFYLGAGIGSFLNVVIYRVPLGISVNNPKRSFCFSCKKQIPWYRNLPLITWVVQRGKCAECGARISFRYFFVELLTGLLFYAVFRHVMSEAVAHWSYPSMWSFIPAWGPVVVVFCIFTALLVAGTFIDIAHYILPHSITLGGLVVGLLSSFLVPAIVPVIMFGEGFGGEIPGRGKAMLISFSSACLGLGLLWAVVELGKLAFGRRKLKFDSAQEWNIAQPDENEAPVFTAGDEKLSYNDFFGRPSDRLIITTDSVTVNERTFGKGKVEVYMETIHVLPEGGQKVIYKLEEVKKIEGRTSEIVIPREAMGFGDVLLIAMIGSFLGWQAVLFTIVAASMLGSVFAILTRVVGHTEWSAKIPFGPYLAGGAMIWLFYGPQFVHWYLTRAGFREAY
jgi:leader peptidase (prepilin peptidase)/N-methyltransferase